MMIAKLLKVFCCVLKDDMVYENRKNSLAATAKWNFYRNAKKNDKW